MSENPPAQSLRKHRQTLITDGKRPDFSNITAGLSAGNINDDQNLAELPTVGIKDREKIGQLVKKRFSSRPTQQQLYDQDSTAAPKLPSNAHDLILEVTNNDYTIPPKQRFADGAIATDKAAQPTIAGPPSNDFLQPPSFDRRPSNNDRKTSAASSQLPSERQIFLSADFEAKTFISDKLSHSTDTEISEFADKLSILQESLLQEKKDEMHSNYLKFLYVGRTISSYNNELESLRKTLNDLNLATTAMKEDAMRHLSMTNNANNGTNNTTNNNSNNSNNKSTIPTIRNAENGSQSSSSSNQADRRASVIAMEQFWQRNLTSLFRHVEGAQKYLPVIPGRHIIKEQGGWYELNSATWKPVQPIHIFLLNDHLLIATKRRSRETTKQKPSPSSSSPSPQQSRMLIASQCWSLLDIEISEVKSYPQAGQRAPQRAICVKYESMKFIYRSDKADFHEIFLDEFRKAKQEFYQLKTSSRRHASSSSGSSHSRSASGSSFSNLPPPSPSDPRRPSLLARSGSLSLLPSTSSSLSKSALVREVDQSLAELDLKIAHRQFSQVVDLILRTKPRFEEISEKFSSDSTGTPNNTQRNASTPIIFSGDILPIEKLEQRITSVTDLLMQRLSEESLSRDELCTFINMLNQLGASDSAKKTFLAIKHKLLQRRVKQVPFQGDIPGYILQVSFISFQIIASTVDTYLRCYSDAQDASTIVVWAKSEVDSYSMLFARQLHNVKPTSSIYQECCAITRQESAPLKKVNIDFSFMLDYMYDASNQKT